MDVEDGEERVEQPLDLSLNSARSSVTTPQLAEKRTLLQEDSDPQNELGEAKKSRYSENGGIFEFDKVQTVFRRRYGFFNRDQHESSRYTREESCQFASAQLRRE